MVTYPLVLEMTTIEVMALGYALSAARELAMDRNELELVKAIDSLARKIHDANERSDRERLGQALGAPKPP